MGPKVPTVRLLLQKAGSILWSFAPLVEVFRNKQVHEADIYNTSVFAMMYR